MGAERGGNSDVRKLRNRMSQKAFRARQAMRVKELEERLQKGAQTDTEWVSRLQDRNTALQDQLLECHKKFTSLQLSMKALADASAHALGIDGIDNTNSTDGNRLCSRCKGEIVDPHEDQNNDVPSLPSDQERTDLRSPSDEDDRPEKHAGSRGDSNQNLVEIQGINLSHEDQTFGIEPDPDVFSVCNLLPNVVEIPDNHNGQVVNLNYFCPSNASERRDNCGNDFMAAKQNQSNFPSPNTLDALFSQDLGPNAYKNIWEISSFVSDPSYGLKVTNSSFSDHIDALEYCVRRSWSRLDRTMVFHQRISQFIQYMLLSFVNISWQSMTPWHTCTKAHIPLKELMAWDVNKTPENFVKIVPPYRPTRLQMAVPHPSIIDWIPWPAMRDKLITHHSANPHLDDLICDIGNSYVVPADLSLVVKYPQPILGYISVWDLVRAIAPEATQVSGPPPSNVFHPRSSSVHSATLLQPGTLHSMVTSMSEDAFEDSTLPAPDATALFSSKSLAVKAFKLLNMDSGAYAFCLDPEFFQRHPELYETCSNLVPQGPHLRPPHQVSMVPPQTLDASVFGRYQEMSKLLIDACHS